MKNLYIDESNIKRIQLIYEENHDFTFGVDYIEDSKYSCFDMHYELEIGVVLSGTVTRYYQTSEMDISCGQIWLSNMWEPHGIRVKDSPAEVAIFVFKPTSIANLNLWREPKLDLIAPFFSPPDKRPQIYLQREKKIIVDIAKRAEIAIKSESKRWYVIIKLLTLELLTQIQENWNQETITSNSKINDYFKINPALDLIFHNKDLISVKHAAKECGLSEKTFSRKFKKITGYTFSQYSLAYRVKSSANDLLESTKPIKEIVFKWGFSDESHYNKLFHKYFQCNPGEYRIFKKNKLS